MATSSAGLTRGVAWVTPRKAGTRSSRSLAHERHPTLILMDTQLPGISGIEALLRLQAAAGTRAIPVIAVMASVMTQDTKRIMAAGFDGYHGNRSSSGN